MQKIFFHIDVNSAYLSWTSVENLRTGRGEDLRLIPSIIGGDSSKRHGIVLAKSIPAKKYHIRTGEPITHALQKYPNLVIAPPDHQLYQHYSEMLMNHLSAFCPDIEQVSVDECYMNFSSVSAYYKSPEQAAALLKDSVRNTFGFTVNIGISDKKVLAKMASDFRKPDLVHTLYSHEIRAKMWPMPVAKLFLCGQSSTETLRKLGINTIGDLAASDPSIITAHLKSHGQTLWNYANGIDDSIVITAHVEAKGIGNSTTLPADVTDAVAARKTLLALSESVAERLRQSRKLAGLVCVEIKYASFHSVSHQKVLYTPCDSADILYEAACALFDELWNGQPIRLLGVRTGKLSAPADPVQISLFDLTTDIPDKKKKLDQALDSIRARYGKNSVVRGTFYQSDKHSAMPNDSIHQKDDDETKRPLADSRTEQGRLSDNYLVRESAHPAKRSDL